MSQALGSTGGVVWSAVGQSRDGNGMQESSRERLVEVAIVLAISLVAAWLRLYRLDQWSFWLDEALTVSDSLYVFNKLPLLDLIHGRPLNYWVTGWVFHYIPVSEFSARIVPCLAGVAAVPVGYYLSREFLGRSAALMSSCFLALSSWHIYWSQNARGYSLLLLFSLISFCLFYEGLERGSKWSLTGSLIALGIAYIAHPVALLLMVSYCVYLILLSVTGFEKPQGFRIAVLWVIFLPLTAAVLTLLPGVAKLANHVLMNPQGEGPLYVFASIGYYVQPVFMVLGASGVAMLIFRRSRLGLYLASLVLLPLSSLLVISAIRGGSALYSFMTLPLFYMGAAIVLTEILESLKERNKLLGICVILAPVALQSSMVFEYFTYQYGDRPRWREATHYVQSASRAGDLIFSPSAPVVDYYLGSAALELRRPERAMWLEQREVETLEVARRPIWILLTADSVRRGHEGTLFKTWLGLHCQVVRLFEAWTSAKNRSVIVYRCGPSNGGV